MAEVVEELEAPKAPEETKIAAAAQPREWAAGAVDPDLAPEHLAGTPRPGDPEWLREFPDDPDAPRPAQRTQAAVKSYNAHPADPESARRFPEDDTASAQAHAPNGMQAARALRSAVRVGDPEWPRLFPEEGGAANGLVLDGGATRKAGAPGARRDDPEFLRRWPEDESGPLAGLARAEDKNIRRERAVQFRWEDHPRFVMGEGIDNPAAELAEAVPLVRPLVDEPEDLKAARATTAAGTKAAKASKKGKPKSSGKQEQPPEDSEEATRLRVEKIKARQAQFEQLRDVLKAEIEPPPAGKEEDGQTKIVWAHSLRARNALEALASRRPLGVLQGRILDAATQKPIPARVRVVDASDTAADAKIPDLGFWCDGTFGLRVISGKVRVEISAGRFRRMFIKDVFVDPEQATQVDAVLLKPPHLDFAKEGWHLADLSLATRLKTGETSVWAGPPPSMDDAVLAARAEGIQVLGLALPWEERESRMAEAEVLAGFARVQTTGMLALATLTGPQHPFCGSAMGIGVTSWSDVPRHLSDPRQPLREHFEDLRRRGGLAVFNELAGRRAADPRREVLPLFPRLAQDGFFLPTDTTARLYAPSELPFDTVVGSAYEALAFDGSAAALALWFTLLEEGYAIPLVGAGGKSLEGGGAPFGQTFVRIDGPPSREKVVAACRRGASFVSFGPAALVKVFERDLGPGDRLLADGKPYTLLVRAYSALTPGTELESLEILRNGKVVHTEKCEAGLTQIHDFRYPFSETKDAFYSVRVTERVAWGTQPVERRVAISNPIYFDIRGRTFPAPARSRMQGVLRSASGAPLSGTVVILEPDVPRKCESIGVDGRYDVSLAASGALVFESPGHASAVRKPFEHPKVQRALGALHAEREGKLKVQLAKRSTYGMWRLLLMELNGDVELKPAPVPQAP